MNGLPPVLERHPDLDTWIRIDPSDTVTLFTGKVELGQGLVSAIARIGAEELDLTIERVRVETADTAHGPDEGITAGSDSMSQSGSAMRQAAAEARTHLLGLASARCAQPEDALRVEDGTICNAAGVALTSYWELLGGRRFDRRVTGIVSPKRAAAHRVVGKPGARVDLKGLVMGTTPFVQDLRLPGMLHARVVRPPSQGAQLESLDDTCVHKMPGVVTVVRDGSFLGVIAEREEQAVRAREALRARARWRVVRPLPDVSRLHEWLAAQPAISMPVVDGTPVAGPVDVRRAPRDARTLHASFTRPFQMHASIGPSAALAQWRDRELRLWCASQGIHVLRRALADALDLNASAIRITHVIGPGCYGHNGADDAALDAALLARAVLGRPVLLKWMREDEHAWEPYGPPATVEITAQVDQNGRLSEWILHARGLTHNARPFPAAGTSALLASGHRANPVPRTPTEPLRITEAGLHRNATPPYDVPRKRIAKHLVVDSPLRTSSMRSLGAYVNVFAIESSMDELAHLVGEDPLQFRLAHLSDERARAVLLAAANRAGWNARPREPGRGMGVGFARYKNRAAYAAVVVRLGVDDATAKIVLEHAVIAADAGQVIDPEGLVNQLEGGFVQSASWTLKEQVRFDGERITSVDWAGYPILTFPEIPRIETILLDRPDEPYLGAGEATQGPTGAAIANAVFDATGIRLRALPFTPERIRETALDEPVSVEARGGVAVDREKVSATT